jgi:O-antigen/teichoic acid export membrane protein
MNHLSSPAVDRPRSRRQGTLAFAATTFILNGLNIVRGLVLVPLYLHYVGEGLYGAWLASGSIVAYLGLCDCGLNSVIIQKVGEAYGAGDSPRLARYLGSGLLTVVLLSPFPVLLGIICAPHLPHLLGLSTDLAQSLVAAFILASGAVSLMIVGHALGGIVCALQRQLLHGLIWIGASVIGLLLTVILLITGYGLMALAWGLLIQSGLVLLMEGAVFWHLQKQILAGASLTPAWGGVVELMKPSVTMFLARGGTTLAGQSDNLLIGMFMGPQAVLVYDLTKRGYEMLRLVMGMPIASFTPALAHFFGELRGEMAKARGLTETLIHVSAVTGLVLMGGYVILDRSFVSLWVGPSFYAGDLVVILIGIYGLLSSQALPLYQIVFSRGQIYTVALATVAEGVLRVLLLVIMLRWLGLPGVALAGVISLAATGWWILWDRYRRDFRFSWYEALQNLMPLSFIATGIMGISLAFWGLTRPTAVMPFIYQGVSYLMVASLWVVVADRRIRTLVVDVCRGRPLAFFRPT